MYKFTYMYICIHVYIYIYLFDRATTITLYENHSFRDWPRKQKRIIRILPQTAALDQTQRKSKNQKVTELPMARPTFTP